MTFNDEAGFSSSYVHNVCPGGFQVLVFDRSTKVLQEMGNLLSPSFLRRNDFQVTFCSKSSDALRHIEESNYDLMFIGYDMLDHDVHEFLSFIDGIHYNRSTLIRVLLVDCVNSHMLAGLVKSGLCERIVKKENVKLIVRDILREVSIKAVQ